MNNHFPIIYGLSTGKEMAAKIAKFNKWKMGKLTKEQFADGEIILYPNDTVRGQHILVVQSTGSPCNDNLMELMIFIDALYRAQARTITVIVPYYGYSRQDRKSKPREPITAKLVANLLQSTKINQLITCDIHSGQIQGFFDIPFDNIEVIWKLTFHLKMELKKKNKLDNILIVSPDQGGVKRARSVAKLFDAPLCVIDKRRPKPNESEINYVIGNPKGKHCIIVDDMIDTAGTLVNAAKTLHEYGAIKIDALATHGIFSNPAIKRIENSKINEIYISDTLTQNHKCSKIKVISISDFLAKVIYAIYTNKSISNIYLEYNC